MKIKTALTALVLGLTLALALLWLPILSGAKGLNSHLPPARAADLKVCASGCDYTAIQDAVDAANEGDVIKVAEGDYNDLHLRGGIPQVVYVSKTVTIRGGYTIAFTEPPDPETHPTTINASGLARGLVISGPVTVTVEGLHITGGNASGLGGGLWGLDAGGGVYVVTATATISNNRIFSNTAQFGGGLYLDHSAATLSGNTVASNTVGTTLSSYGGGLCLHSSAATLSKNTVTSNTACYGGGLFLISSEATLNGNTVALNNGRYGGGAYLSDSPATISNNTIATNTAQHYGGGLFLEHSPAFLNANTIISNTAADNNSDGGGLHLDHSDAMLSSNTIASNTSGRYGGGMCMDSSDATLDSNAIISNTAGQRGGGLRLYYSDATLTNTIIANNQANTAGSAMYIIGSSPWLLHATIARNSGGDGSGVYITNQYGNYSTATFTNTILVSHTVGVYVSNGSTATLEATLWGTDTWGNGADWSGGGHIFTGTSAYNYWENPAFVGGGDYRLTPGSAAIDAGVEAGVTHDIDGGPRPFGAGPDVGADEVSLSLLKTAPATATTGDPITYTLTLTNDNSFPVTNVVISDAVPAGATYVSGGSCAGDVVSWTVASIAPSGGVAQVHFVVTATATITNSQYRVVTSSEGLSTDFGPPVTTIVIAPPCHALTDVGIIGPGNGYTGTLYAFTAIVTPSNATLPVTYTWQATEQTSTTRVVNDITDTVQFTWNVAGTQTVSVTAANECGVAISATHVINIESATPAPPLDHHVYLPLVLKSVP